MVYLKSAVSQNQNGRVRNSPLRFPNDFSKTYTLRNFLDRSGYVAIVNLLQSLKICVKSFIFFGSTCFKMHKLKLTFVSLNYILCAFDRLS